MHEAISTATPSTVQNQAPDQTHTFDRAWFESCYHEHGPQLLAFIRTRIRSDATARDIAQQTWLKIWKKSNTFDGQNFRAWMFSIARNLMIDHSRRKVVSTPLSDTDAATQVDPLGEEELAERTQALAQCLQRLSQELRGVVQLRLHGEPYERIANTLEIPLGTAHSRFGKAKEQLKRCIEDKLV